MIIIKCQRNTQSPIHYFVFVFKNSAFVSWVNNHEFLWYFSSVYCIFSTTGERHQLVDKRIRLCAKEIVAVKNRTERCNLPWIVVSMLPLNCSWGFLASRKV